jgi:hypothetical protein
METEMLAEKCREKTYRGGWEILLSRGLQMQLRMMSVVDR